MNNDIGEGMTTHKRAGDVLVGDVIPMRWAGVTTGYRVVRIDTVGKRLDIITEPPAPGRMLCSANESLPVTA